MSPPHQFELALTRAPLNVNLLWWLLACLMVRRQRSRPDASPAKVCRQEGTQAQSPTAKDHHTRNMSLLAIHLSRCSRRKGRSFASSHAHKQFILGKLPHHHKQPMPTAISLDGSPIHSFIRSFGSFIHWSRLARDRQQIDLGHKKAHLRWFWAT